jgi:hypothetical protein
MRPERGRRESEEEVRIPPIKLPKSAGVEYLLAGRGFAQIAPTRPDRDIRRGFRHPELLQGHKTPQPQPRVIAHQGDAEIRNPEM